MLSATCCTASNRSSTNVMSGSERSKNVVYRFGCDSGASPYRDDHDGPEGTLHLEFAGHVTVPYRQGNANRNDEGQCGRVVSRRAYNEKDQIQGADYPEEMSNGITAEQHRTEQGIEACEDESEDDQSPPAPGSGEIFREPGELKINQPGPR